MESLDATILEDVITLAINVKCPEVWRCVC